MISGTIKNENVFEVYSSPRMREKPIIKPTITSSATSTKRIISNAERTFPAESLDVETSVID